MMKKLFSNFVCFLMLVLIVFSQGIQSALAKEEEKTKKSGDADTCRAEVTRAMAIEHRYYRVVLFGQKPAEEASPATVRYSKDGNIWYKKIVENENDPPWYSISEEEGKEETLSNEKMDQEDENADYNPRRIPRRGIFDTQRVLTSELIPYLIQALHGLQCQAEIICEVAMQSIDQEGEYRIDLGSITVNECQGVGLRSYVGCHVTDKVHEADILTYCSEISKDMLEREAALLKFAIEYDAAYRTYLQFAGMFDHFLREWRWTLISTFRQLTRLIGWLDRIPCFTSSCMEYPPEQ